VPEQLDDALWNELLLERDTFKLAIRGFAAIEGDIAASIDEAFEWPLPHGARGLGAFDKRLAVAAALGIVPQPFIAIIRAVAKLRHDFAHGNIDTLTPERSAELRGTLAQFEFLPADLQEYLEAMASHYTLVYSLIICREVLHGALDLLRVRREDQQQLVALGLAIRQRLEEHRRAGEAPEAPTRNLTSGGPKSYIRDRDARRELGAELRRTEVLVGELLGPAENHGPATTVARCDGQSLGRDDRMRFRQLAAHAPLVERLLDRGGVERAAASRRSTSDREIPASTPARCAPLKAVSSSESTIAVSAVPRSRSHTISSIAA
jgi:hypothetical protein